MRGFYFHCNFSLPLLPFFVVAEHLYPEKPSKKKKNSTVFLSNSTHTISLKKHFILQLTKVSVFPLFHLRTNIYIFVFCYPVYYISSTFTLFLLYICSIYTVGIHIILKIYIKEVVG